MTSPDPVSTPPPAECAYPECQTPNEHVLHATCGRHQQFVALCSEHTDEAEFLTIIGTIRCAVTPDDGTAPCLLPLAVHRIEPTP